MALDFHNLPTIFRLQFLALAPPHTTSDLDDNYTMCESQLKALADLNYLGLSLACLATFQPSHLDFLVCPDPAQSFDRFQFTWSFLLPAS